MSEKVYKVITDQLVEALETCGEFELPWRKCPLGLNQNPQTGTVYSGINALVLMLKAHREGYASPYWLTFKGAQKMGGQVRQDQRKHGTAVIYFKMWEPPQQANPEDPRKIPVARYYRVFNAEQCEGIEFPAVSQEHTKPSDVLAWVESTGAAITHGGNQAFYMPSQDRIQMPHRSQFTADNAYASTMLHELTHWTGHKTRLDRLKDRNGNAGVAFEELIAELGSVFLCAEQGIEYNPEHHASYLKSWLKALQNDRGFIVKAASKASKAVQFINDAAQ